MKKELRLEPYNRTYQRLLYGDEVLAVLEIREAGYLVLGKRKPVSTLKAAAKQILDAKMNKCMKEHEGYRKILQRIFSA